MRRLILLAAAAIAVSFTAGAASAETCPIGDLSTTAYCLTHPCTSKICTDH